MLELTLVPTYGRDYSSYGKVLEAWRAGKDFRIATVAHKDNGRYTSVRDLAQFPGQHVKIRYNKLADFVLISVKTGEASPKDETEDYID